MLSPATLSTATPAASDGVLEQKTFNISGSRPQSSRLAVAKAEGAAWNIVLSGYVRSSNKVK